MIKIALLLTVACGCLFGLLVQQLNEAMATCEMKHSQDTCYTELKP